jgi:hypothetical protein
MFEFSVVPMSDFHYSHDLSLMQQGECALRLMKDIYKAQRYCLLDTLVMYMIQVTRLECEWTISIVRFFL